ncbi:12520_t:CDS:2, partial [Ambispora leptoticha]
TSSSAKGSETEKPPSRPVVPPAKPPIDKNFLLMTFQIDNVPAKREDIFNKLTLEEKKEGKKLTSAEEKTIIGSLASQVGIDKNKSFFDYRGKFFVKINDYSDLSRFEYEKESMLAINEAVPDFAPYPFWKVPEGCEGEFSKPEFWAEYQKYYSLPPGFGERRDLYQLYDYLYRKGRSMVNLEEILRMKLKPNISKQIQESHFIDLCRPEVEEGVCSECEKWKQAIEVPFGTKQKPNSHIYRMCSVFINQLRLNLKKEIDKGEDNFASAEDFRKVQECFVVAAELENILKTNEF